MEIDSKDFEALLKDCWRVLYWIRSNRLISPEGLLARFEAKLMKYTFSEVEPDPVVVDRFHYLEVDHDDE